MSSSGDDFKFTERWQAQIAAGVWDFLQLPAVQSSLGDEHTSKTPERFVKSWMSYFNGYTQNPEAILRAGFEEKSYSQMIFENDVRFISHCCHHIAPFFGRIHFAYIPDGRVVGLSKIPRMIEAFARRLQIQERLSFEIASTFQRVVKPIGCGVVIEAQHFCVCARGVEAIGAYTRTAALEGKFLTDPSVKAEFLASAKSLNGGSLL